MSTFTITQSLQSSVAALRTISTTPDLDAEILLAHVLQTSRSHLHAWPEKKLSLAAENQFKDYLTRRLTGEPIAHILGHQEFWSLDFLVTPAVLVPRPETELLVELTLKLLPNTPGIHVADLGTGSGAIALALASERPHWIIHATDHSAAALEIAKKNAQLLGINNVVFHLADWCQGLPSQAFNAIISNPPYLAESDPHLQNSALGFEPKNALIADENGLAAFRHIIQEAPRYLQSGGYLLLEHGFEQAPAVIALLQTAGFKNILAHQDLASLPRVVQAQFYHLY